MPQPEDDPKSAAKKERYKYGTDQLMNQFLKMESGGLGRSPEYRRGHVWNFEWCSEDPAKARPKLVAWVKFLMERPLKPLTFDEAFEAAERSITCAHVFENFEWGTTLICKTCGIDESDL